MLVELSTNEGVTQVFSASSNLRFTVILCIFFTVNLQLSSAKLLFKIVVKSVDACGTFCSCNNVRIKHDDATSSLK